MANSLIVSATSAGNGTTADLTLLGAGSGELSAKAARTPEYSAAVSVPLIVSPPPPGGGDASYSVELPASGHWYIWVLDDNGPCAEPAAVWVTHGTDSLLAFDEVGRVLQERVTGNLPLVNAALQAVVPTLSVRQVVYGGPSDVKDYPAIMIIPAGDRPMPVGMPYLIELNVQYSVILAVAHQEEHSRLRAVVNGGEALTRILSQRAYDRLDTPSGISYVACRVYDITVDDTLISDGLWVANARLTWRGIGLRCEP